MPGRPLPALGEVDVFKFPAAAAVGDVAPRGDRAASEAADFSRREAASSVPDTTTPSFNSLLDCIRRISRPRIICARRISALDCFGASDGPLKDDAELEMAVDDGAALRPFDTRDDDATEYVRAIPLRSALILAAGRWGGSRTCRMTAKCYCTDDGGGAGV